MHVEAAYNVLGSLFPRNTITEASPKGKQVGTSSGTRARSGVNLGTKNTKKEKVVVGEGKLQPCKGALFVLEGARLVLLTGCLHSPSSDLTEHGRTHVQRCRGQGNSYGH